MSTAEEIIRAAAALPVAERAAVVESLLASLQPPDAELDRLWSELAQQRLRQLRSGRVAGVSGESVFAKVRARFGS